MSSLDKRDFISDIQNALRASKVRDLREVEELLENPDYRMHDLDFAPIRVYIDYVRSKMSKEWIKDVLGNFGEEIQFEVVYSVLKSTGRINFIGGLYFDSEILKLRLINLFKLAYSVCNIETIESVDIRYKGFLDTSLFGLEFNDGIGMADLFVDINYLDLDGKAQIFRNQVSTDVICPPGLKN